MPERELVSKCDEIEIGSISLEPFTRLTVDHCHGGELVLFDRPLFDANFAILDVCCRFLQMQICIGGSVLMQNIDLRG